MKLRQNSGGCGLAMTLYNNISKSKEKQKVRTSHSQLSSVTRFLCGGPVQLQLVLLPLPHYCPLSEAQKKEIGYPSTLP